MGRYSLHAADQVVIAGYFLLLAAVGFYFWRRMRHVRDLFTGGPLFGVGCLLMCSAVMLPAGSGRTIDVAVGLFLCISGGGFYVLGRGRG
jgi:hypothetical protein